MSQVKRFDRLPIELQREIEKRLLVNGFSGYAEIAAELRRSGYRISRSGLHRHGQQLKKRVRALRDDELAGAGPQP